MIEEKYISRNSEIGYFNFSHPASSTPLEKKIAPASLPSTAVQEAPLYSGEEQQQAEEQEENQEEEQQQPEEQEARTSTVGNEQIGEAVTVLTFDFQDPSCWPNDISIRVTDCLVLKGSCTEGDARHRFS